VTVAAPDVEEDRLVSRLDPTLEPERFVRRIELITSGEGRRRWTADDKARIVAETLEPGAVVSEVARRHGLTPQQLFTWRRAARQPIVAEPMFVPAVVGSPAAPAKQRRRRRRHETAAIEVEIGGVVVRVGPGARSTTVAAVIRALKAGS